MPWPTALATAVCGLALAAAPVACASHPGGSPSTTFSGSGASAVRRVLPAPIRTRETPTSDVSSRGGDAPQSLAPRVATPLAPPARARKNATPSEHESPATASLTPLVTMASSLAVVLGLFFLVTWGLRRAAPRAGQTLPNEVLEVLGRSTLPGRQQVHLVRCANKLLLLSVGAAGVETLTEITDTAEVERVAGLCHQAHPQSSSIGFRQLLEQMGTEPHSAGFLGDADRAGAQEPAKRRASRESAYA